MRTLLIAVGMACAASASVARTYPTKSVRMIAPFAKLVQDVGIRAE